MRNISVTAYTVRNYDLANGRRTRRLGALMNPSLVITLLWTATLLAVGGVFWASRLIQRRLLAAPPWPGPWPRVTVIMPAKGAPESFAAELATFLDQDYPDFELILAVEDASDPAHAVALEIAGRRSGMRVVCAGQAPTSGQKNHNLLAGLAAADPESQVLVFSDSGHQAPPDWLRRQVEPIASGKSEVTSGFHHAVVDPGGPWSQAWLIGLQFMFWSRHLGFMCHPWGGSTAITRRLFDELRIAELWSRTVVDDVTLSRRLRRAGRIMHPVPAAPLLTRLRPASWGDWFAWLNRQLAYIKFIAPISWLLLVMFSLCLLGLLLIALGVLAAMLAGAAPVWFGLAAGAFLVLLYGLVHLPRHGHPQPGPLWKWGPGTVVLLISALPAFAFHTFSCHITWGGIRYQVGLGGRVRSITRPGH